MDVEVCGDLMFLDCEMLGAVEERQGAMAGVCRIQCVVKTSCHSNRKP